jgi:hypothetical protein
MLNWPEGLIEVFVRVVVEPSIETGLWLPGYLTLRCFRRPPEIDLEGPLIVALGIFFWIAVGVAIWLAIAFL